MAAVGIAFAFVKRYLYALSFLALFLISLTPVLWYSTKPDTTGAGRMLYAPAVFLCVLVGIGIQNLVESTSSRRLSKVIFFFQTVVAVGIAACWLSTAFQADMWKSSASISKNTLHYVIKVTHRTKKYIHIKNLPVLYVEGPFILKSYAFPVFAEGKYGIRLSKVRSHWVYLSYRNKDFVQNVGCDPFSEYWKEPGECVKEFTIVLPLSSFR
jgi:hypothetical protein